jgi:hypothetical protein
MGHEPENAACLAACAEFFGPAETKGSVCLVSYKLSISLTTYPHGDLTLTSSPITKLDIDVMKLGTTPVSGKTTMPLSPKMVKAACARLG